MLFGLSTTSCLRSVWAFLSLMIVCFLVCSLQLFRSFSAAPGMPFTSPLRFDASGSAPRPVRGGIRGEIAVPCRGDACRRRSQLLSLSSV
jgi:hypothetical protein